MWNPRQQVVYEACAADFTAESGIGVEISRYGFGEYWDLLSTNLAAGSGPDVFTNHVTRFPQFLDQGVIATVPDSSGDDYEVPELAELWKGPDGQRYGYPKDVDSIGLYGNNEIMESAGLAAGDLAELDWNLTDGGSFASIIAHLTVDENGVRGDEDGFDPTAISVFGFAPSVATDDAYSRTGWSIFAYLNGWTYTDANPWPSRYNYDDTALVEVLDWFGSLADSGYMPSPEVLAATGGPALFESGQVALLMDGSWNAERWSDPELFAAGVSFGPTPKGPDGSRVAMVNGLADAINAATSHPDEALAWVEYLASPACQEVVGATGVVVPALSVGAKQAYEFFNQMDLPLDPFFVPVEDGGSYLFPISDQGAEIDSLAGDAVDGYLRGLVDADGLANANTEINALIADQS